MSATEESGEEEEARRHEMLLKLLDEAEEQVRGGRVSEDLLARISQLRPYEAAYFIDRLENSLAHGWYRLDRKSFEALSKVEEAVTPKVAEYVKERFGVEVPVRASRGWTDAVIEKFKDITVKDLSEVDEKDMDEYLLAPFPDFLEGYVSWDRFEEVLKYVPAQNFLDRQNESPTFLDFIEAAAKVPGSYLHIYIVNKLREDERVTIDGILLPVNKDSGDVVREVLRDALDAPDEVSFFNVKGEQYIWLWWD